MENSYKYFRDNVSGTLNLLEAMQNYEVPHFVFSSTCATFGIPKVEVIEETTPQAPINPYRGIEANGRADPTLVREDPRANLR